MAVLVGAKTVVGFAVDHIHNPDNVQHAMLVTMSLMVVALVLMFPLIREDGGFKTIPTIVIWVVWAAVSLHTLGRGRLNAEGSR